MPCSIMNQRVQLVFQGTDTEIQMMSHYDQYREARKITGRSALQRPNINRAELAALLRKGLKRQQSSKSKNTYWRAFLNDYKNRSVNNNESESIASNDT